MSGKRTEEMGEQNLVTLTVDGKEFQAPAGELLIKAAQDQGVYIPRFCWHERMKPVGMCRMCLVQVDGVRGLPPACTTRVTDGMVVQTESQEVRKAQEGVLEFLLINHPLDCPVCDRGGECPLQDHTLAFGPGESRFVEEKRHFAKPIAISDLVDLDRERCIQCGRCTRFADEIAGDPLIDFVERGGHMQVLTFPDEPFLSYFSGNTVQICPVGALTANPYRFRARPWDLETVETSCQLCAVGCRGALQSSTNVMVRLLGVDSSPVNHGWLCDKGRFAFEYVHSAERATSPAIQKRKGEFVDVSWPEALDAAADGLTEAVSTHGPESVALLGGARGTNEDAYLWARLMKGVLGSDNVDCQVGDGLPAEAVLGLPQARIDDCDTARAIVLMAPDLKEELPVLYLRLRRAAVELGVPIIDVAPRDHGLSPYATAKVRYRPGEEGGVCEQLLAAIQGKAPKGDSDGQIAQAANILAGKVNTVVVAGRPSLAESSEAPARALAALAGLPGTRVLSALRRGNVHGALDMGLAPGVLPGRVSLDEGRGWFAAHWGAVPLQRGRSTEGILRAAVVGDIKALVILGSNPAVDFPDRDLARQALESVPFVVAVGSFVTESSKHAKVVLPTALWGEKDGTTTNIEGRVMRLARKVTPAGTSMEDWRIAVELAARFDVDLDLESVYEVQAHIARVAPAYVQATPQTLLFARDGVVVPPGREEPVMGRPGHPITPWADAEPGLAGLQETQVIIQGRVIPPEDQHDAEASVPDVDAAVEAESAAEDEASPAVAVGGEPPALLVWDRSFERLEIPPQDSYALRLVSGRRLYDNGLAVTQSAPTAELADEAVLLVNPWNFESFGVAEGERVKITSSRGSVVLPVRSDAGTPKGVAYLPFNQPGSTAADLIDASSPVTDIQVETLT